MILSRISRASGSAFHRNVRSVDYNARTALLKESNFSSVPIGDACISRVDGGLGIVRSYLTSAGAGKQLVSNANFSKLNSIFASPRLRRFFSSEAPKKKRDSGTGDVEDLQKEIRQLLKITPLLCLGSVLSLHSYTQLQHAREISFEDFKTKLLEPGLVDRIVVSNKSVAKVYMKVTANCACESNDDIIQVPVDASPGRGSSFLYDVYFKFNIDSPGRGSSFFDVFYYYYFNIDSVEYFEEKLEEAQEALGIDPHDHVPVTYVNEVD